MNRTGARERRGRNGDATRLARDRGYATLALSLLLPDARAEGLPYVEITTDPDIRTSQRVIEANGGVLVERFVKPPQYGGVPGLRYRIVLA